MLIFMTELSGDEIDEEKGTEAWTNDIDRGGLWQVNDTAYTLLPVQPSRVM